MVRCDTFGVTITTDAVSPTSWSLQRPPNSPFLFKICNLDLPATVPGQNLGGRDRRWTLLAAGQRCADREQQTFESLVVTSKRKISHLQGWILSSVIDFGKLAHFGGFAEEKWNFNHRLSHSYLFWDLGQRSTVMLLVCNFICVSNFCYIPVSLLSMSVKKEVEIFMQSLYCTQFLHYNIYFTEQVLGLFFDQKGHNL